MVPVDRDDMGTPEGILVGASAPSELLWVGHRVLNPPADHRPPDVVGLFGSGPAEALAHRMRTFWGDGVSAGVGEFLVLADQAGLLFVTDLSGLLRELPAPDEDPARFRLRSETAADRRRFIERIQVLRADPAVRRRYAELLRDLWAPVRPEWERQGFPAVLETCQRVRERLRTRRPLEAAVPEVDAVARQEAGWGRLIDEAQAEGRLALVPGYFGGRWSLWDLPAHLLVGFRAAAGDPLAETRVAAQRLAPRLRVLGDPTRLALLMALADRPASVVELARRFSLAQPTVSAHLRALRDAQLVLGTRADGRTRYRVDGARLESLLQETGRSLAVGGEPTTD